MLSYNQIYLLGPVQPAHRISNAVATAFLMDCDLAWPEYIYFLRHGDHIKIGHTTDLERRLRVLDAATPDDLQLLGVMQGSLKLERAIHKYFAGDRYKKEWFHAMDQILNFIHFRCEPP